MIKKGINTRLPEIGKIKIGGKGEERTGKNGKFQLPVRYNHFVITTTERDPKTGNFVPDLELMEKYNPRSEWREGQTGPEPKEIPILLLYDSIDLVAPTSYALYAGASNLCRGDGEVATRVMREQTTMKEQAKKNRVEFIGEQDENIQAGESREIVCDLEKCPFMQPDKNGQTKCKPSVVLSCILPDSQQLGGVYRFRSHSWNTVANIMNSLEFLKQMTNGVLVGIPMKLVFLKKATEGHGNVNVVAIVADVKKMQEVRELALIEQQNRQRFNVNMKLLEDQARQDGVATDTDDPAEVEAEFYSPNIQGEEEPKDIGSRAASVLGNVDDDISDADVIDPEEEEAPEPEAEPEPEKEEAPDDDQDELDIF